MSGNERLTARRVGPKRRVGAKIRELENSQDKIHKATAVWENAVRWADRPVEAGAAQVDGRRVS